MKYKYGSDINRFLTVHLVKIHFLLENILATLNLHEINHGFVRKCYMSNSVKLIKENVSCFNQNQSLPSRFSNKISVIENEY